MSRLFVGVPVSEEIRERILPLINSLGKVGADLNLVPLHNLHFTVKFLGETDKTAEIREKLAKIVSAQKSFTISLKQVGVFPSLERINVIWVGTEGENFIPLMKETEKELNYIRKNEFATEVPHLTIARVRSGRKKWELQEWVKSNKNTDFGEMEVKKVVLYESELMPEGPVYIVVEEFKLK